MFTHMLDVKCSVSPGKWGKTSVALLIQTSNVVAMKCGMLGLNTSCRGLSLDDDGEYKGALGVSQSTAEVL